MMQCPKCGAPVLMTSHQNQRNGKWTVLPLEQGMGPNQFDVLVEEHEAFGILGDSLGAFLVSVSSDSGAFRPHSPSHFLEG